MSSKALLHDSIIPMLIPIRQFLFLGYTDYTMLSMTLHAIFRIGAAVMLLVVCASSIAVAKTKSAGEVFIAKKIITMAPKLREARWVAVHEGRIVALGRDRQALKKLLAEKKFTINRRFRDKVIMPGLIDPHLHPIMAAVLMPMVFITPEDWTLPNQKVKGVRTARAYRARLKRALREHSNEKILFTWGYHQLWHGEMSRAEIDKIAGARPVIVWHRSFHEIFVNSAAMKLLGFEDKARFDEALRKAGANPAHADYQKGMFHESALPTALAVLRPYILSPERLGLGLALLQKMLLRSGVTTIADMASGLFAGFDAEAALIAKVFDRPESAVRILLVPEGSLLARQHGSIAKASRFLENRKANWPYRNLVINHRVKLLADGAFFSQFMQMNPPGYLDGHEGKWITEPEELHRLADGYWRRGFSLHVHVNGDRGLDVVLDALEGLRAVEGSDEQRFVLEHVGYATWPQIKRAKSLRADASMQPNYLYVLADKYSAHGLGADRAHYISRTGSFERAGVNLTLHSDLTMAPSDPLFLAWIAVNRMTMDGSRLAPKERLSVAAAMQAITINAARVLGLEREIGSIEPGKRADFTILRQDPYAVSAMKLKDIGVDAVVFGGKVHKSDFYHEPLK